MTPQDDLKKLNDARKESAKLKEEKYKSHEQWLIDNAVLICKYAEIQGIVAQIEDGIRLAVLYRFQEDNDKKPAPGIVIKIFQKILYDPKQAYIWALSHRVALQLDIKEFEKIAKVIPVDFVTISEEPKVMIAADLDRVLI